MASTYFECDPPDVDFGSLDIAETIDQTAFRFNSAYRNVRRFSTGEGRLNKFEKSV